MHFFVDGDQRRHVEQAATQPGLIGRDDDAEASVVEPCDRFQAAGNRAPLLGRLDELVAVAVDDAVAVQDDELARAGRDDGVGELGRTTAARSISEQGRGVTSVGEARLVARQIRALLGNGTNAANTATTVNAIHNPRRVAFGLFI